MPSIGPSTPPFRRNRGVSPVVGAALLFVVAALLAVTFAMMAYELADALREPTPQVAFETEYVADGAGNGGNGAYVNISHVAGDVADGSIVYVRDESGNEIAWESIWTGESTVSPGGHVHIDGRGSDGVLDAICEAGQTYYVVVEHPDDTSAILREVTIPHAPTSRSPEC
ncbi:type IV pilin [Halopelagius longus]|uniref:Flagellin (Archaellin), FlaG/FlaF family n=1 Tax=Halopelagius longus TaxID=1236180 RepID=A0A1H0Z073_9EURY|nr:type IV pilin N-terminal domain-containing protein [Halopelagius longus]RDI72764.1 type IV pilin [Halopelagius longus]SDQ20829.1 flagellin (archaellin), FlaG/FlaF family [Halopelagius longus]